MTYKISEKELSNINLFVPSWFTDAAISGAQEEDLKSLIKENLTSAYKLAKKKPAGGEELNDKVDDLYAVYSDSLNDYRFEEE